MSQPKISVVMSSYNRPEYVKIAIESILNQTYKDFEFIIFDNGSTDNTGDVIRQYAQKDDRIVFIQNPETINYIHNLRKGIELAKGEYIARMDDDDISEPARFEKQVAYLDSHPDITLLGTFIKPFGSPNAKTWVNVTDQDEVAVAMNFYDPICHSAVMIRKDFLRKHNLNYSLKAPYAEDYDLWAEILLHGGKLANLPEELLDYRKHDKRVTSTSDTQKIQNRTAENVREKLLSRFYNNKKIVKKIRKRIFSYLFKNNNKKEISDVLDKMRKYPDIIPISGIEKFEKHFCGIPSDIQIFFTANDKLSQHLCVAITSILINSLSVDNIHFYILDGGISQKNKKKIEQIKKIKNCSIEYIKIDDGLFADCPITTDCPHITKQTYYRYIIPKLKSELDKAFYFDCDIVVEDSLNNLWNIDLGDNYVAAVEELWTYAHNWYCQNSIKESLNAGIMLINLKKWKEDNISDKLFKNTNKLIKEKKLKWQDQDVLNYTLKGRIKIISPKYNLQQTAFFDGQHSQYSKEEMYYAKIRPVIIHYSGIWKPWDENCLHPLWKRYYNYLKYTSYKKGYYKFETRRILKNLCRLVYREKVSDGVRRNKLFGLTIIKTDKRNFYCKKTFLGITFYKKFLIRQYLDNKFGYFDYRINNLERKINEISKKKNNLGND